MASLNKNNAIFWAFFASCLFHSLVFFSSGFSNEDSAIKASASKDKSWLTAQLVPDLIISTAQREPALLNIELSSKLVNAPSTLNLNHEIVKHEKLNTVAHADSATINAEKKKLLPQLFFQPTQDRYLPSDELTVRPQVLFDASIDQSIVATDALPLSTNILLLINEVGLVDSVILIDSNLSEEAQGFIQSIFSQMIFTPGELHQRAVKTELMIEIQIGEPKQTTSSSP